MASFSILSFGCKVNQCDSQIIRETLSSWGLDESGPEEADLNVINTCAVTATAEAKFRKALRRAKRENPRAYTLITGCIAEKDARFSLKPVEADLVFGIRDFPVLADFLEECGLIAPEVAKKTGPQSYFAEHTRAFLKIQDGCDRFCSYCIVPLVRPNLWSEDPNKVVDAINNLAAKGYREVTLTGIHLGFYGRDTGEGSIEILLERIKKECEIERIRLSSIEINEVSDKMLALMADSNKFCRHLHLPLQSGDNEILKLMGRGYTREYFLNRVKEIQQTIPDIGITTDVMVGFPGESNEQFVFTAEMVRNIGFAKSHVFRYSPRPGTKAAEMGSLVPARIISARARKLLKIAEDVGIGFKEQFIGKKMEVLLENCADNGQTCVGLTSNYIRVRVSNLSNNSVNRIVSVLITGVDHEDGLAMGEFV